MTDKVNRIFVITGEQSGDLNAANLIKKLYSLNSNISVKAIGGDFLKSVNAELIFNYNKVNFVGFSAVIKNYFRLKKIFNYCVELIKSYNPEVILLVDFPGFNLKISEKVRKFYKGKIVYYISPQIWAWHKSRIKTIKNNIDKMLVVFPFEVGFYAKEGMKVFYSGNPLLENIDDFLKTAAKKPVGKPVIALMPGSRNEEFKRIFPLIAKSVPELKKKFDAHIILIHSKNISLNGFSDVIGNLGIKTVTPENETEKLKLIYNSDLVITKFGTSSTECAFLGTPFISVYKANRLNYIIARKLIKVNYATMVNIIAGKEIVKEFIQSDFTKENIIRESEKILKDKSYRDKMTGEFGKVKEIFYNTEIVRSPESILNDYLTN